MTFQCVRCGYCCKVGEIPLTEVEVKSLYAVAHPHEKAALNNQLKSENGRFFLVAPCPFLTPVSDTEELCRIHEIKPFACRWYPPPELASFPRCRDDYIGRAFAQAFWLSGIRFVMKDGSIIDPTLFAHAETQVLGATTYYLLKKDTPADGPATELNVSNGSTGYIQFGDGWVFQLTGVAKILATTWSVFFRSYLSGGTSHGNFGITVLQSDGSLRATLLDYTTSPNTAGFTGSYATYSVNYAFAEYTVVDQTDWLRVGWWNHCTAGTGGKKAYINFDNNALAQADQVRVTNVSFQAAATTAYKDIATRFKLWVRNFKDIATRFKLWVQGYTDIATRFRLTVQAFKDIATRFKLIVPTTAYKDIATRFKLTIQGYKDVATRFKLTVQAFQDICTRFKLTAQNYKDIATRFILWIARDIATRFKLSVQGYQDIATRFRLTVQGYLDISTRFRLVIQGYKDISTRFKLTVGTLAYKDVATRFKLTVQAYKDTATRFKVWVQAYKDTATRFVVTAQGYKDIATRFKLNALSYKDATTRFILQVRNYADITTRFRLLAQGYKDITTRFSLHVRGFKDIGARFLVTVQGYKDAATRFLLTGLSFKDITTRFTLSIPTYKDITTRFRLWVQGYKDATIRFKLWVQGYQDVASRFYLGIPFYKDIATRFRLNAQAYQDVSTRFFLYQPDWYGLYLEGRVNDLEAVLELAKKKGFSH